MIGLTHIIKAKVSFLVNITPISGYIFIPDKEEEIHVAGHHLASPGVDPRPLDLDRARPAVDRLSCFQVVGFGWFIAGLPDNRLHQPAHQE